jgi:hypothetical protein
MQKIRQEALSLVKQAVFSNHPFIVLTMATDDLTCAFEGKEETLVEALTLAMKNDTDLKRIVRRAMHRTQSANIAPTILKLKTA